MIAPIATRRLLPLLAVWKGLQSKDRIQIEQHFPNSLLSPSRLALQLLPGLLLLSEGYPSMAWCQCDQQCIGKITKRKNWKRYSTLRKKAAGPISRLNYSLKSSTKECPWAKRNSYPSGGLNAVHIIRLWRKWKHGHCLEHSSVMNKKGNGTMGSKIQSVWPWFIALFRIRLNLKPCNKVDWTSSQPWWCTNSTRLLVELKRDEERRIPPVVLRASGCTTTRSTAVRPQNSMDSSS